MRRIFLVLFCLTVHTSLTEAKVPASGKISFYKTPLVCGANSAIGCGARSKPILLELEATDAVKEAWLDHGGTIVAIVWKDSIEIKSASKLARSIFSKHDIEASLLQKKKTVENLLSDFRKPGKWYRGSEVDSLSLIEAVTITEDILRMLPTHADYRSDTVALLKYALEQYVGAELIGLKEIDELDNPARKAVWQDSIISICNRYLGQGAVVDNRLKRNEDQSAEATSVITCPYCGHKKAEALPEDRCLIRYQCEQCKEVLTPKAGDCCVFCSYGTVKCPSEE